MKRTLSVLALFAALLLFGAAPLDAQQQPAKPRASLKAGVMQRIGTGTDITIEYSRPGVKGRKIWGELVPYGLAPGNKSSNMKPFPWRGGANENTTIRFSTDVAIEGNKLPAGRYGVHFIPG